MWDHQVAALSGTNRCLRPDAPGCGLSPEWAEPYPIEALAEAVLEALDERGVGAVAVAGLSMGGYLALALLRLAPERLRGLALLATRATADSPAARDQRTALAADLRGRGQAAVDDLAERMAERLLSPLGLAEVHVSDPFRGRSRRCSAAGLAGLAEAMRDRADTSALLPGLDVPVLVVAGGGDTLVPAGEMEAMAGTIPGARFELVAGAGHLVNLEQPALVSALLDAWLVACG